MIKSDKDVNQEKTLIFLHIGKTGGITLQRIIERLYKRSTIFTTQMKERVPDAKFKKLSEKQRAKIRLLKGHMEFGLHEFLPQPATYVTLLRHPVKRAISAYDYIFQRPDYYLYHEVTSRRMSLKDYVCSGINPRTDNAQTRVLSGVGEKLGFGKCTTEILEIAKKNLREHFAVAGLTEKFDETLILLKRTFGWKNVFYARRNITAKRRRIEDIPKDTLEVIERYNEQDIQLYNYAKEMLEEQIHQQSPSFERELQEFKSLNQYYGKIYALSPNLVIRGLAPFFIRKALADCSRFTQRFRR